MMQQQGKLKRCPSGAMLDMAAVDFEGCISLLEAVQVAVESGNLPQDVCADALLSLGFTFRRALKDLKAEVYEDAEEEPYAIRT